MAAVVAAFFILVTAVVDVKLTEKPIIACPDRACVEKVVESASHSPYVRRLRVFDERPGFNPMSNVTAFPAIIDLTFD